MMQLPEHIAKDKFRQHVNRLLNECFILKQCEETRQSYYFLQRERETAAEFLSLLGYELILNEDLGVIALNNLYATGRIHLRLFDSIILLLLRLIYIEEKQKLSQNSSASVEILVDEIYDRFRSLRSELPKKTELRRALGLLKRYHIITNLDADMGDPDTRILIYPSVLLSLDHSALQQVYEISKEKLSLYGKGGDPDEPSDEEIAD